MNCLGNIPIYNSGS